MPADINLQFIREKLDQIGIAIMYTTNDDVIKLPNDIIQYLKIEDTGQLWFTAHKPRYWLNNYEQCFPVRLFFYRKGVDFYIEMNGSATVAGKEEMALNEKEMTPGSVLFKMTPSIVEYTETKKKNLFAGPGGLYTHFTNWVLGKLRTNNISRHDFSRLS